MDAQRLAVIISLALLTLVSEAHRTEAAVDSAAGYQPGTRYSYRYKTQTTLDDKRAGETKTRVSLLADVDAVAVWLSKNGGEKLIRFQVKNWSANETGLIAALSPVVFLVNFSAGKINSFHVAGDVTAGAANLCRGIASMFQYQTGTAEVVESDVTGDCVARYIADHHGLEKTKGGCAPRGRGSEEWRGRSEKLLDVDVLMSTRGLYKVQQATEVVESARVVQRATSEVAARREMAARAVTTSRIDLVGQYDSEERTPVNGEKSAEDVVKALGGQNFVSKEIYAEASVEEKPNQKFQSLVSLKKRDLKSKALATREACEAFKLLVEAVRNGPAAEQELIDAVRKNKDVAMQLIDVLGAAGTWEAHRAAMEVSQKSSEPAERYFWALAQLPQPSDRIVRDVFTYSQGKIRFPKLKDTLVLTLATMSRKLGDEKLASEILKWLMDSMSACKKEPCKLVYLRALKNVGSASSTTLPILLNILRGEGGRPKEKRSNSKVALAAVKALQSLLPFEEGAAAEVGSTLVSVFRDVDGHDSSVRAIAFEILLKSAPSKDALSHLLEIAKSVGGEFASYCLNRVQEYSASDPRLREVLEGGINWDLQSLAAGFSTTFSRMLAETRSGNASFSFGMEMSGPAFKRSTFEVNLENRDRNEREQLLQLDIFADGLESLMGSDDDAAAAADPSAGMELRILGNSLRPFVFFESTSDIMSLYWSGKLDEKTSALQGTQLLQDSDKTIRLMNGLTLRTRTLGSLSYDFSGQAQISIWTKSCESVVENSAALLVNSDTKIELPWNGASLELAQKMEAEARLNLETEIDAGDAEDVKLCIRMQTPKFVTKDHSMSRQQKSNGKPVESSKSWQTAVEGRTLYLNDKNSQLCAKMYPGGRV